MQLLLRRFRVRVLTQRHLDSILVHGVGNVITSLGLSRIHVAVPLDDVKFFKHGASLVYMA